MSRKGKLFIILIALLVLSLASAISWHLRFALAKEINATTIELPPQQAYVASPRVVADESFIKRHNEFLRILKTTRPNVIFFGDSLTDNWHKHQDIWETSFGQYNPANFGISGDHTQNLLWRIINGELDDTSPKVIVLQIGTNNTQVQSEEGSPENIATGIKAIVDLIIQKQPGAKILLIACFPRGEKPASDIRNLKLKTINSMIAKLDDGKRIHYLDFADSFLRADGTIAKELMPDFLHLSSSGYRVWADAITPKLTELMR